MKIVFGLVSLRANICLGLIAFSIGILLSYLLNTVPARLLQKHCSQ